MKIFLDTLSLFKLYPREDGTVSIEQIFSKLNVTNVYLPFSVEFLNIVQCL